jgi:hypothetical protein
MELRYPSRSIGEHAAATRSSFEHIARGGDRELLVTAIKTLQRRRRRAGHADQRQTSPRMPFSTPAIPARTRDTQGAGASGTNALYHQQGYRAGSVCRTMRPSAPFEGLHLAELGELLKIRSIAPVNLKVSVSRCSAYSYLRALRISRSTLALAGDVSTRHQVLPMALAYAAWTIVAIVISVRLWWLMTLL